MSTGRWPIRLSVFSAGALALAWSAYCLPTLVGQAPLESVARRILSGEAYQPGALTDLNAGDTGVLSKWQRPSALAAQAAVDLRFLERAMVLSDSQGIDGHFSTTERAVQRALAATPANPFLWTVFFWIENNRRGFRSSHLNYLRMSYKTGPSEGWVATIRTRFAIGLLKTLPSDLAELAVGEFSRLVVSRLYHVAIDVLSRQPDPVLKRLLASLNTLDIDDRARFAKAAYRQGFDWNVPGVERPEWRPWH